MKPATYLMLARRQDSYWWHRSRRMLCRALLERHGLPPNSNWLDLGCGPGGNLQMMDGADVDRVVGLDLSPLALELAQQARPHSRLVRADLNQTLPFRDSSFGLVTIFNVLYHQWIEDEGAILAEARRVLVPGGLILITEPAFPVLSRGMDVAAMARRRYHLRDFNALLANRCIDPVFGTYFTSFGFPLLLIAKLLSPKPTNSSDHDDVDMRPLPTVANGVLLAAGRLEAALIRIGVAMPFGTTLLQIGRRPI